MPRLVVQGGRPGSKGDSSAIKSGRLRTGAVSCHLYRRNLNNGLQDSVELFALGLARGVCVWGVCGVCVCVCVCVFVCVKARVGGGLRPQLQANS